MSNLDFKFGCMINEIKQLRDAMMALETKVSSIEKQLMISDLPQAVVQAAVETAKKEFQEIIQKGVEEVYTSAVEATNAGVMECALYGGDNHADRFVSVLVETAKKELHETLTKTMEEAQARSQQLQQQQAAAYYQHQQYYQQQQQVAKQVPPQHQMYNNNHQFQQQCQGGEGATQFSMS